jgi:hypothetical protein
VKSRRWALVLLATVALMAGAALWLLPPQPAALPASATALELRTQPWRPWPFGSFGCGLAALTPIRGEHLGSAMVFADEASGTVLPVVWPSGYSARLLDGRAELVRPDGSVLARDGDVISNLASGAADNGDLLVCLDSASAPLVEPSP